ncbi:DNA polymerase III subunit delta [Candidatus Igneacidithiobacillus taiwanensis]|uniref:DNA polymerase III subunit delta n=1 Tax=Candidatus Igneacidithiobacillus taiwanensis TaxID=1945924 RepID=UPI0028979042|nr:DNA polymerase III subunit delta [Candidatus Igneacidithiobacillus taiwanensis]MCE5360895.1 DNA polymerase III subunit delta [Acidithiobacillus sp.]
MRVKARDWPNELSRGKALVCALFSDAPLLLEEAAAQIQERWRGEGFVRLQRLPQEDPWKTLREERDARDLFAEERILLLRLPDLRLGKEAAAALERWLAQPPSDARLLLLGPRPDSNAQKLKWFQILDRAPTVACVLFYPPELGDWPRWVAQRLRQAKVRAEADAIALLAERSLGNLSAADQAIRRWAELYPGRELRAEDLPDLLGDSSQFSIFDLSDTALQGEAAATLRSLERLRSAEAEPVLILWALHRELRLLLQLQDGNAQEILRRERLFPPRSDRLLAAARRLPRPRLLQALGLCQEIDARIKGQDPRPLWPALADLALVFCQSAKVPAQ